MGHEILRLTQQRLMKGLAHHPQIPKCLFFEHWLTLSKFMTPFDLKQLNRNFLSCLEFDCIPQPCFLLHNPSQLLTQFSSGRISHQYLLQFLHIILYFTYYHVN